MNASSWLLSGSYRFYRLLLRVYPAEFRRRFGDEMLVTFRDCAQEELEISGTGGLYRFWGIVVYDLMKSVCIEHIAKLRKQIGLAEEQNIMSATFQLNVAQRTDRGLKRAANEDSMIAVLPEDAAVLNKKGALFVVADGMGGYSKGDVASEMTINTIRDTYYQDENSDVLASLKAAVQRANQLVCQASQESRLPDEQNPCKTIMGSTCVAAVLKGESLYIANAGDTFAYLIRGERVSQLAEDHSWLAQQVREGALTEEDAQKMQEKRNLITRCLGEDPAMEPYITVTQVQKGDVLVLCTDGLHQLVSEQEMRAIVAQHTPEESTRLLVERANANGGPDNSTAVVVRVD